MTSVPVARSGRTAERPILIAVAVVIALAAVCFVIADADSSDAASEARSGKWGNLDWNFSDGTLTVSGSGDMEDAPNPTSYPWYAFREDVKAIHITDGVTSISRSAFTGCFEATTLDLGGTVKTVGTNAFRTAQISYVKIPDSVEKIAGGAFATNALTSVHIGKGVSVIGNEAFRSGYLNKVTVDPANPNLRAVDNMVFSKDGTKLYVTPNGSGTTELVLPEGLVEIVNEISSDSINSVTIPSTLSKFGCNRPFDCKNLRTVNLAAGNTAFKLENGCLMSADGKTLYFHWDRSIGSFDIPEGVETIGSYAFYNHWNMSTVTMPSTLVTLGYASFLSCSKLDRVSVTASFIGDRVFYGCGSLSRITFATPVTYVGYDVLRSTSVTNITLTGAPGAVIAEGAFAGLYRITGVTLEGDIAVGDYAFRNSGPSDSHGMVVRFGVGVRSIGEGAFMNVKLFTNFGLPDTVTYIGPDAFKGMTFKDLDGTVLSHTVEDLVGYRFMGKDWVLTKQDYGFSFETNGGNEMADMLGINGYPANVPDPVREGYVFAGWYSDPSLSTSYDVSKFPRKHITLYAKWTSNTCTLTLDSAGYTDGKATVKNGSAYITGLTDASRPGYNLLGYASDAEGKTMVIEKGAFVNYADGYVTGGAWTRAGDATLYAVWEPMLLDITLEPNGGDNTGYARTEYDSTAVYLYSPVARTGYALTGYFTDKTGGIKVLDRSGYLVKGAEGYTDKDGKWICASNVTLYAVWDASEYSIELDKNGGTDHGEATAEYDSPTLTCTRPVFAGYTLSGYYATGMSAQLVADAAGVLVASVEGYTDADGNWIRPSDTRLFAGWVANEYTITFDPNGGTLEGGTSMEVTFGSGYTLPVPTLAGMHFAGWELSGTVYASTGHWGIAGSVTLTAAWEDEPAVEIKFVGGEGSTGQPISIYANVGDTITLPSTEVYMKEGYDLTGWILGDTEYDWGAEYEVVGEATFTAAWKIVNALKVSYLMDGQDIEEYAPTYHSYGETVTLRDLPSKTGYDLTSWYSHSAAVVDGKVTMPLGAVTVETFSSPHVYSLTLRANGGDADGSARATYDRDGISFFDPVSRPGYVLTGFFTAAEGGTKVVDANGYLMISDFTDSRGRWTSASDVTLYAQWQQRDYDVSVLYILEDGSSAAYLYSEAMHYGDAYSVYSPEIVGYTCDKSVVSGTVGTEDVRTVVTYTPDRHTITFDTNGGSDVEPVTRAFGTEVSEPEDPVRDGSLFRAWTLDGSDYVFGTMPAEDLTLTASWYDIPSVSGDTAVFSGEGEIVVIDLSVPGTEDAIGDPSVATVKVEGSGWSMEIPKEVFSGCSSPFAAGVSVLTESDISDLPDYVREMVDGRTVYNLSLSDEYGDIDFTGTHVTVRLPYEAGGDEDMSSMRLFCIGLDGEAVEVPARYDSSEGCIVFSTDHMSLWYADVPEKEDGAVRILVTMGVIAVCLTAVLLLLRTVPGGRRP